MGDTEGQAAVEMLMSMAHSFSCDKQGRINLNDELIAHAGIKKSTVLLGKLSTFSIYSDEVYETLRSKAPISRETQADVFKRFGL
jgi:DNA-binding transcriptional regulator/RsmH inhibitor MraZ